TAAVARVALAREQARMSLDSREVAVIMNREYVGRLTAARRAEVSSAPPLSVLLAGVVVGFALAYLAALASEMRRPRVGSVAEVPRTGGGAGGQLAPSVAGPVAYSAVTAPLTAASAVVRATKVTGQVRVVSCVGGGNAAVAAAHYPRATLLADLDTECAARTA